MRTFQAATHADRWLDQFRTIKPARRQELRMELIKLMNKIEKEALTDVRANGVDLLTIPVNTYWFERQYNRKPKDDETKPWEFHAKFDGQNDIIGYFVEPYEKALFAFRKVVADGGGHDMYVGRLKEIVVMTNT